MKAKTVDEALNIISGSTFRLNNLFQCEDGQWQANLREKETWEKRLDGGVWVKAPKRTVFHDYARGKTPLAALNGILSMIPDEEAFDI